MSCTCPTTAYTISSYMIPNIYRVHRRNRDTRMPRVACVRICRHPCGLTMWPFPIWPFPCGRPYVAVSAQIPPHRAGSTMARKTGASDGIAASTSRTSTGGAHTRRTVRQPSRVPRCPFIRSRSKYHSMPGFITLTPSMPSSTTYSMPGLLACDTGHKALCPVSK